MRSLEGYGCKTPTFEEKVCGKKSMGFTMVELVMVVAILALLMVVSLPAAINFYKTRQLDVHEQGIVQVLRRAQLKAMAVERDSAFGVFVASNQYVLFVGDSYAGRDSIYDEVFELPDNIEVSGLSEIVFSKLDGITADTGTINLVIDSSSGAISINEMGRVNY